MGNGYGNAVLGYSTNINLSRNDNIIMMTTDTPLSLGDYNIDTVCEEMELTEFQEAEPHAYDKSFNQFYTWV